LRLLDLVWMTRESGDGVELEELDKFGIAADRSFRLRVVAGTRGAESPLEGRDRLVWLARKSVDSSDSLTQELALPRSRHITLYSVLPSRAILSAVIFWMESLSWRAARDDPSFLVMGRQGGVGVGCEG
jgi:hypothetical protein